MKKLVVLATLAMFAAAPGIAFAQDGGSAGTTKQQHTGADSPDNPASQNNTKPDNR
jgi:hypothetical protein